MTSITDPPDGWSVDPGEMQEQQDWGSDGEGTAAAARVGLTNPKVLMVVSKRRGGDAAFFAAGGKFYLWNRVVGQVVEYVAPANLDGILAEMRKAGGQVEVKVLIDVPPGE